VNILVSGVGGQGVILFSDLLASVALAAGLDVKKSEVHGMAQRGGSVTSHVRYGTRVLSPIVEDGTADLVVAFEKLEAVRWVHALGPGGRLAYDSYRWDPLPVMLGLVERPDDRQLDERLRNRAPNLVVVPAFEVAGALGNTRVQNVVMFGAVSRFLEFPASAYQAAIRTLVKPEHVELNLAAFERGLALSRPAATTPDGRGATPPAV